MQEKITVVFIAGTGRSGSTMLELILNESLHQTAVGELFYFWNHDPSATKCGCGLLIKECPFWRKVFNECGWQLDREWFVEMRNLRKRIIRRRNIFFLLYPSMARRALREDIMRYVQRLESLYLAIAKVSNSGIVVDPSKFVFQMTLMNRFKNINFKVIHLMRDPRAVVYSWGFNPKRTPESSSENSQMERIPLRRVVLSWWIALFLPAFLRGRVEKLVSVSYDDLAHEPKKVLQTLLSSFHLSGDVEIFDGTQVALRGNHTGAGNPIRFQSSRLVVSPDERWRVQLPFHANLTVLALTWPWFLWKFIRSTINA